MNYRMDTLVTIDGIQVRVRFAQEANCEAAKVTRDILRDSYLRRYSMGVC